MADASLAGLLSLPPMPFTLIAGPCLIESRDLALEVAGEVKAICDRLGIDYVFKAS